MSGPNFNGKYPRDLRDGSPWAANWPEAWIKVRANRIARQLLRDYFEHLRAAEEHMRRCGFHFLLQKDQGGGA